MSNKHNYLSELWGTITGAFGSLFVWSAISHFVTGCITTIIMTLLGLFVGHFCKSWPAKVEEWVIKKFKRNAKS